MKGLKNLGLTGQESNPDLYDAGAVLLQTSYQANWELVIMWVYDKLVDSAYLHSINITKEFMFAGINMFWARFRLILKMSLRRALRK